MLYVVTHGEWSSETIIAVLVGPRRPSEVWMEYKASIVGPPPEPEAPPIPGWQGTLLAALNPSQYKPKYEAWRKREYEVIREMMISQKCDSEEELMVKILCEHYGFQKQEYEVI